MKMNRVPVNGQEYVLRIGYQADAASRAELNRMTNAFWGFDFEPYYQSGYWDAGCIVYSLFLADKMVAHTTLSIIDTNVGGKQLKLGQLGTVMCDEAFQRRGLARFLMEQIQTDYAEQLDGYFLFANETVLDFYPKFGFVALQEYQASMPFSYVRSGVEARKLDLELAADRQLFENYIKDTIPTSKLHMDNFGLTFFYCYAYPEFGFKDSLYHLPSLDTIAVAQVEAGELTLFELFHKAPVDLLQVVQALGNETVQKVVFGFSPIGLKTEVEVYKDEDLTLFVSEGIASYFKADQLMVPLLSHT